MQNESCVFTAVNIVNVIKNRYLRWYYLFAFVGAVIVIIVSLVTGNRLYIIFSSLLAISFGMNLLPDRKPVPITLTLNNSGFDLQNAESDNYHDWNEVKLAQYNGRYLDVFCWSSFRKSIDLQMFAANDQVEILRLAGRFLAKNDVFISEKNPSGQAFA